MMHDFDDLAMITIIILCTRVRAHADRCAVVLSGIDARCFPRRRIAGVHLRRSRAASSSWETWPGCLSHVTAQRFARGSSTLSFFLHLWLSLDQTRF